MNKVAEPQIITLPNGLRLVHIHRPGVFAGIFGVTVGVGSATEEVNQYGLAHLVEHNIFKGTTHRRSWQITNRIESDGGELNAFTSKEETTIYAIFPKGNPRKPIELIADLAINSNFPERELEKEREVVIDEIYSYRDTPMDAVYDDFEDMVFARSPLGHNILGSPESVRALGSADCQNFVNQYYTVSNSVLFYSGPDSADRVSRIAATYFATMPVGSPVVRREAQYISTSNSIAVEGLHQSHSLLGIPVGSIYDDSRFGDALFCNMLGGPGMNSLLNVELRERRGLVYTVESSITRFASTGLMTVYFGCDAEDTTRCRNLVKTTSTKLAEMDEAKLKRVITKAKKQYCGQLAIASENNENRIMNASRAVLFNGTIADEEYIRSQIEAVNSDFIRQRAAQLANADFLIYHP